MRPDAVPIPAWLWRRICAFLKAKGTGDIVLHVNRGTVDRGWINAQIEKDDARAPPPSD